MSATNRGAVRCEADRYITPDEAILSFYDQFKIYQYNTVLEPCAGNGALIKKMRFEPIRLHVTAVEIRPEEGPELRKLANSFYIADFLNWDDGTKKYDLIITNPPFSIAQKVIEHCFEISDENTDVAMLLRLNFFGSQERKAFWNKYPVRQLYPLSKRPSYGTHCKCMFGHKHFYGLDQRRPDRCPDCNEKWKTITTTDATDYGWFVWSSWRPPLIKVI